MDLSVTLMEMLHTSTGHNVRVVVAFFFVKSQTNITESSSSMCSKKRSRWFNADITCGRPAYLYANPDLWPFHYLNWKSIGTPLTQPCPGKLCSDFGFYRFLFSFNQSINQSIRLIALNHIIHIQ